MRAATHKSAAFEVNKYGANCLNKYRGRIYKATGMRSKAYKQAHTHTYISGYISWRTRVFTVSSSCRLSRRGVSVVTLNAMWNIYICIIYKYVWASVCLFMHARMYVCTYLTDKRSTGLCSAKDWQYWKMCILE